MNVGREIASAFARIQLDEQEEIQLARKESTGQATIHKAGCQHAADSKSPFSREAQADDWFNVAPCAR